MSDKNLQKQLRDKAIEQLLLMLEPSQVVALNMNSVAYDGNRLFLRVPNRGNNSEQYKFALVSPQTQEVLETFLEGGRPLYGEKSEALFPNRFGRRMSIRSINMQHGKTSRELVKRKVVVVGEPCGDDFVKQFNQWNRTQVIYFAQRKDGAIKIGCSTCFSTRFQTLESEHGQMELLGLVEGDRDLEARLLNRFRGSLVEGKEWFRPNLELLAFIQRIVREGHAGLSFQA